jgi:hypothetical protein
MTLPLVPLVELHRKQVCKRRLCSPEESTSPNSSHLKNLPNLMLLNLDKTLGPDHKMGPGDFLFGRQLRRDPALDLVPIPTT